MNPNEPSNQPVGPNKLEKPPISDAEAQALLTVNSLDTAKTKQNSKAFLYFVIALIVILVGLSLYIGSRNHADQAKTTKGTTSSSSSDPFSSGLVDSEVKYCSNPVNATTTC